MSRGEISRQYQSGQERRPEGKTGGAAKPDWSQDGPEEQAGETGPEKWGRESVWGQGSQLGKGKW